MRHFGFGCKISPLFLTVLSSYSPPKTKKGRSNKWHNPLSEQPLQVGKLTKFKRFGL